jgi:hypothetical protein
VKTPWIASAFHAICRMKFLFHALTTTKGIYNYWNIYLVNEGRFCFEDLSYPHHRIEMKIDIPYSLDGCTRLTNEDPIVHTLIQNLEQY